MSDLVKELFESDAASALTNRAARRIEALEAENERLRAAISWIEPPFVDDKTPEVELRKRASFCVDAARAALKQD